MREFGGPDVLRLEEVPDPEPRPAHLLVDITLGGVNWADVHVRNNTYLSETELPFTPGNEIVGTVDGGRRVVALTKGGGYAEKALVHRRVAWDVPDDIADDQAVALALQGNSAWHILFTVAQLRAGETVVIPAAAGGVGTIAVQLAQQCGAKVIALAGTESRRRLALELGATVAIDSAADGLTERIKEAAGGPVQVALEMSGGEAFHATVEALAPRGRLAVYGYASGKTAQIDTQLVMERSISVNGFWLPHLYADRHALPTSSKALYAAVRSGSLRLHSGGAYALGDAAQAHQDLEARTKTGKLVIDTTR
jgi:NADPH:quinone reductase